MVLITHARVLRVAVPIVLANVTIPLLGAVDTAVVGQIGLAAPIGAVGLGAIILTTLYWVFGFLRMGTSGLAAQAQGAGDQAEVTAILLRALMLGGAGGLCLVALQIPLTAFALTIAPGTAEVEGMTRAYLGIRIWGAPATIALYAITGWLIALERTRAVLVLQLVINGVNIGLDLWFVLGLGWGVQGVAIATLIAEATGLTFGLWLCRGAFGAAFGTALARLRDAAALRQMLVVNGDIMVRSVLLQGCFTTFLFLGAGFGDVTLAANQVLMQFLSIAAYFLDGFAFAAEALVGQAVGMRSVPLARRAAVVCSQWGVGAVAGLSLCYALGGPMLIDLMTTAPEVRAEARHYLPWLVAAPLIGVAAWMLDGIFIGATLTRDMRQAAIISVAVYAAFLLVLVPTLGNHGLWLGLMVLNVTRGVTLGLRLHRLDARAAGLG
jgi:MATE family multidrug resistance protein